jgi:hypothetical protein
MGSRRDNVLSPVQMASLAGLQEESRPLFALWFREKALGT